MIVSRNLMECCLSNETRRATDRPSALIVRRFAAEYALSQASGALLRYRSDCRERNFAIFDLFLPLRARDVLFCTLSYRSGSFSLSRNYSLLLSSSRCRPGGHHVRDPCATRVTDVTSPVPGDDERQHPVMRTCSRSMLGTDDGQCRFSHYRADEKIARSFHN